MQQIAKLMLNLPLSAKLRSIALYYQAHSLRYIGDLDGARRIFSSVAETSSPIFRARALQYIGVTYHEAGKVEDALPFYISAGRTASECDPLTVVESQQMIAILLSLQGDHQRAIDVLEKLLPTARIVGKQRPEILGNHLNNLAVELGEVGRIEEAYRVVDFALASPFASAHPEWRETRDELEAKRTPATPSFVAITRTPEVKNPEIEESKPVQLKPKPRLVKTRSLIWLQLATNSPPKKRPASRTVDHLPLIAFRLDRLRDSIKPRAPPSRI